MLAYITLVSLIVTSVVGINKFLEQCFYGSCDSFDVNRSLVAVIFSLLVASWGLKRKSLAWSGAIGGIFVGLILTYSSYCFLACLFTFFYTSSKATHFHSSRKKKIEADFKEGGQRNWIQVLCNGGTATQIALIYLLQGGAGEVPIDFQTNFLRSWLAAAVLSSLASANGDTWASELSMMTKSQPRLITTCEKVPIGTNGGITAAGTFYSALGGAVVGLAYFLSLFCMAKEFCIIEQALMSISVGTIAGLVGSLFDSLLGATMQYSGLDNKTGKIVEKPQPGVKHISGMPVLDNHSVNLLMTITTSIIVPSGAAKIYSHFR